MERIVAEIYIQLRNEFGLRNWWPSETREETIIGAILVQNVSWQNVVKAINALRQNNLLTLKAIHHSTTANITMLIKPTRFYIQKTNKLKVFTTWLYHKYAGNIDIMFREDFRELRAEMLGIKGLGEETVDSILLYAGDKLIFVIDAYTKRIFSRLGLTNEQWSYNYYQQYFMNNLDNDVNLFNDYHAQIVHLGKLFCTKQSPKCSECPLGRKCVTRGMSL